MCGIWALLSTLKISQIHDLGKLYAAFMKIKHRGPDYSSFDLIKDNLLLGFHRLAIMDLTAEGNQPFHYVRDDGSCVYCICNGEIYDYEKIKKEYGIITKSHSDCEVIIPLYEKVGVEGMIRLLGSEFAFIIADISKDGNVKIVSGRDPIGVRPLFYGLDENSICFSSEMKGICDNYEKVFVFPPGHYMTYENGKMCLTEYYSYDFKVMDNVPEILISDVYCKIRELLIESVKKRMITDRPYGALLSGGLDSSLVVGIMKMLAPEKRFPVFTITIDNKGTDLEHAKQVAEYLDLDHHVINVSESDVLKVIDETIYSIESYDITTVRCSLVQKLLSEYIQKNTDIRVIKVGEVADEIASGYAYHRLAPSHEERYRDSIRLVKNAHRFDGLRTCRTMASNGLEVRLPYADYKLVDYIFSLPPEFTAPKNNLEKALIRDAFRDLKLIPDTTINRSKSAFSDAVACKERSLYEIIQEHVETLVSTEDFEQHKNDFKHCPPFTKESYYYRKKFVEYFGDSTYVSETIPYYWMPKWIECSDPSARKVGIDND